MSWTILRADIIAAMTARANEPRLAFRVAHQIQDDIIEAGWPLHHVLGSEAALAQRYHVGRDALRESIRILGLRDIARMRRGPGGGLVVTAPSQWLVVAAFGDLCRRLGVTRPQIDSARTILDFADRGIACVTPGDDGVRELQQRLQQDGSLPAAPHPAARHLVIDLFSACLDELLAPEDQRAAIAHNLINLAPNPRGVRLVQTILKDVARAASAGGLRFGSEDDLCERYGASKPVLRQALRILQARGLLQSQPGRGGGIMLSTPAPDAVIDLAVTYLCSLRFARRDTRVPLYLLGKATRQLAATRLMREREDQLLRLQACIGQLDEHNFAQPLRWEIDAIGNPIIEIFIRCMIAYNAMTMPAVSRCPDAAVQQFKNSLAERIDAIRRGDLRTADAAGDSLYSTAHLIDAGAAEA
jgi:DNA-binding FadR family transcriptional regulator